MFIKITKNREGVQYVSIVEGYRDKNKVKHRTIKSLGKLKDLQFGNPNYLEELKETLKEGKFQPDLQTLALNLDLHTKITCPLQNYGWLLLDEIYRSLGISKVLTKHQQTTKSKIDLNEALRLLTVKRILDPGSKWKSVATQQELFGEFKLSYQDVYRSLDRLCLLSEEIQQQMHRSITNNIGRVGALVFYDVTNYYFETDLDDEPIEIDGVSIPAFRKRGPSKEKRPNPIVQMGLFMDTNGIPIAFQLFPGNCVDVKTYLPAVELVKKQFGIERIVVIADKGMNSKNNITETLNNEDGYLFSQKIRGTRGAPKDIQNFALDPKGWVTNEKETFAKKSMIRKRILNKKEVTEKILVTWNQQYDFREKVRRQKSVEYAEKLTASERFRMTMKKGGKRYLEVENIDEETGEIKRLTPHISIDEEQIAFDEQFDGLNVLITSEVGMSDDEMITSYRSLNRIEDCFKVMKSTFDARPIYVWTQPHIKAHFLICFISLTIMRLFEHKLSKEFSPDKIQAALQSAQCRPLDKGYWEVFGNDDFLKINELLGKQWDRQYVTLEVLKSYGK